MQLAIIKYNSGNIQSVLFALERIGISAVVTDEPELIQRADKVLFPGVGEASSAMRYLQAKKLDQLILQLRQPVLGICLGMQLLCEHSEENDTPCLGIFRERVIRFRPPGHEWKVPQIGWNTISGLNSALFHDVPEHSYCYFVHSYYAASGEDTVATTEYTIPYSAALHRDNFYGVQFHPEKSAAIGEQILKNFIAL